MNNWNDLSLKEKADVMKVAIGNGIYSLSDIRKAYNEYAEGGPKNNGNPRPITTGGAGYVPSSSSNVQVFNKEKIYNRVLPTEMTGANTGPLDSVKQYLFNNDRAVDEWFENYVPYINNSYGDAIEASRILNDLYKKADAEKEQEFLENSPTMKALMYQNLAPEMFVQEDGKDTYLGMPQRFGTMRDAEYHPVNGKLVNGKYVSYMRDPIFVDTEIIPTYQNYIMGITRKDNPDSNVQRVTKNGNALVYMPFLNNATMSKGYDPNRGEYVSIYDDWDYNTAVLGKAGDNISKFIGGQPFSIYDRYYLDDIFDVPKDKRGSYYLPEVTVTPDKKSTGGPLITLANEFSKGGKIYIKPSHRGKFTRLKERTGHSASWFKENGTPAQKKMATFELNARKWKHGDGGPLIDLANRYAEGGSTNESNNIVDWIIGEEGFNSRPENIGDGKITLGSGLTNSKWHKIYNKKGTWTAEDNRAAVAEEVENRRRWAEQNVPNWTELPADSQNALLSYKYNYNFTPKNSPKLFKALEDKNYEEAARQIDATSSNPRFRKGLQARRQREQEMFMRGINSMNAPESEVIKKPITVQEESIYTPPQSVLDNIAANNGKYMITGYPALAAPQNMLMNALRSSILGIYASKAMDWAKRNHLFESGGPLVDTANKYHR